MNLGSFDGEVRGRLHLLNRDLRSRDVGRDFYPVYGDMRGFDVHGHVHWPRAPGRGEVRSRSRGEVRSQRRGRGGVRSRSRHTGETARRAHERATRRAPLRPQASAQVQRLAPLQRRMHGKIAAVGGGHHHHAAIPHPPAAIAHGGQINGQCAVKIGGGVHGPVRQHRRHLRRGGVRRAVYVCRRRGRRVIDRREVPVLVVDLDLPAPLGHRPRAQQFGGPHKGAPHHDASGRFGVQAGSPRLTPIVRSLIRLTDFEFLAPGSDPLAPGLLPRPGELGADESARVVGTPARHRHGLGLGHRHRRGDRNRGTARDDRRGRMHHHARPRRRRAHRVRCERHAGQARVIEDGHNAGAAHLHHRQRLDPVPRGRRKALRECQSHAVQGYVDRLAGNGVAHGDRPRRAGLGHESRQCAFRVGRRGDFQPPHEGLLHGRGAGRLGAEVAALGRGEAPAAHAAVSPQHLRTDRRQRARWAIPGQRRPPLYPGGHGGQRLPIAQRGEGLVDRRVAVLRVFLRHPRGAMGRRCHPALLHDFEERTGLRLG